MSEVREVKEVGGESEKVGETILKVRPPQNLTRYHYSILENIWTLNSYYYKILTEQKTFSISLPFFLDKIQTERFPETYWDSFVVIGEDFKETRYRISYFYTSYLYLVDYCNKLEKPEEEKVIFQLRSCVNSALVSQPFRRCLVRLPGKYYTNEAAERDGLVEVKL